MNFSNQSNKIAIELLILFVFYSFCLAVGKPIKYEVVEGRSNLSGITQEEARLRALNSARAEAIRIVAGTQLRSETFGLDVEISSLKTNDFFSVFQVFNRSFSSGRVVEEEILEEGIFQVTDESDQPPIYIYRVKLRAGVVLEKGKIDPGFKLELLLNQDSFKDGDEMQIRLKSSKDCYYNIFNVLADETLAVLYPNSRMKDNFLAVGTELTLPSPGTKLRVGLLPGMERTTEIIFVIATKEKVDFAGGELVKQPCKIISSYHAGIHELSRWLANIPLDQRTEASVQYVIKK